MAFGLQLFNSSGTLVFDSTTATGGVFLGIYSVGAGSTLDFPAYVGSFTGMALPTGSATYCQYTASMTGPGGCLRFSFTNWPQTVALFVK
jgi:hypothetical protein